MELLAVFGFLVTVLVGSYIQAVAGFAMGMILVAMIGGLRLLDVPTMGAVVSLLTILNVLMALRGQVGQVHRHLFFWLAVGQVPAIFLGFTVMNYLQGNTRLLLELCLGLFIFFGGLSMYLKPHPWPQISGRGKTWLTGLCGGLVGGMFSASGPVLGWFGYNQPLPLAQIRATLLASFLLTTFTRTIYVGVDGGLTGEVARAVLLGLPVVVIGTWLGRNFAPPVDEQTLKRWAYVLLLVMGTWILGSVGWRVFL